MPKKPQKKKRSPRLVQSFAMRMLLDGWSLARKHPLKTFAVLAPLAAFIAALPSAIDATTNLASRADPFMPAFHYWVDEKLVPLVLVQNTQATAIDRFLLYSQQRDLAAAQSDPAAKTSPIVQEHIQNLKQQIDDTAARIKKAGAH